MKFPLSTKFSEPSDILALRPEELAYELLVWLKADDRQGPRDHDLHINKYCSIETVAEFTKDHQEMKALSRALCEAWQWLQNNMFLVPAPGQSNAGWFVLSRMANSIESEKDFDAIKKSRSFNKNLLHPKIVEKCWAAFIRDECDTAVSLAFKAVEVSVRDASGLSGLYGTDLMRQAFGAEKGPLTDAGLPLAEREALAHLYAGAVGTFRNPQSHRWEDVEPAEAIRLLMLASELLTITELRKV